jgi:predicted pyridoxine 5'-phosphate oxidase superfamily flavin-nucleotide-binding protein
VKDVDHITPQYRGFHRNLAPSPRSLRAARKGSIARRVVTSRASSASMTIARFFYRTDAWQPNRVDSLRNVVRDPHVALLFLIPGSGTTLRVNGRAHLSVAPQLHQSFAVEEKAPRSVMVVAVDSV